jgi:hypothetical protein
MQVNHPPAAVAPSRICPRVLNRDACLLGSVGPAVKSVGFILSCLTAKPERLGRENGSGLLVGVWSVVDDLGRDNYLL